MVAGKRECVLPSPWGGHDENSSNSPARPVLLEIMQGRFEKAPFGDDAMAVRIEPHAEPIPGYRLLERLGGGGFGEVWKAEAPGGLHKAIKFVYGDLAGANEDGQRAEQELKALRRVQTVRHPYILSLERYDVTDGQLVIVMELADRNLWDRFRECRSQGMSGIPTEELLCYMEEVAEALDLMNGEYQLQHLDIKPQNLFLIHNHIKVADFGLVKDLEGMVASVTGGVTPVYAAPETFDGWISRYCDQYSLAIVYQELLTGQRPFQGTNVRQLIVQHLQAVPDVSSLPLPQQPVISRALSKRPDERYANCRDFVTALREASRISEESSAASAAGPGGHGGTPASPAMPAGEGLPTPGGIPARTAPACYFAPGRPDDDTGSGGGVATDNIRPPVEDGSSVRTFCFRVEGDSVLQPRDQFREPTPQEEKSGDGVLFPALVIGLGQAGLNGLLTFREEVSRHLGFTKNIVDFSRQIPHVRMLLLDTDPEVMRQATRNQDIALEPNEVVLAPLNRPSYYLKPSPTKKGPKVESWLPQRMLYRIPRSQVTTGVRALGRLAFFDNYRSILRRLKGELDACLDPSALHQAEAATGLGFRSNRPRIYVLTGLSGGTGSGLFLDLAYTIRALCKQAGLQQPDLVALLLAPAVSGTRPQPLHLGNSYAAIKELVHYATPGTRFQAQYHEKEPPIDDPEPPFTRTIVLPVPEESDESGYRKTMRQVGQFLYRDLLTPMGRTADLARAGLSAPSWESRGLYCQTFNLYPVRWPRPVVVDILSCHLCRRLVENWGSKNSKHLVEPVRGWVRAKWAEKELGPDRFIDRFQAGLVEHLGRAPETILEEMLRGLSVPDPVGASPPPPETVSASATHQKSRPGPPANPSTPLLKPGKRSSFFARRNQNGTLTPAPDRDVVLETLAEIERWLGRPTQTGLLEIRGAFEEVTQEVTRRLVDEWEQKLAELSVRLIEEPIYRLAGGEEGLRQTVALIEQMLQTYEPMVQELNRKNQALFTRVQEGLAEWRSGKSQPGSNGVTLLPALLREYGKGRYHYLVLHQVAGAFLVLRGRLSDELREVNFCRARLDALGCLFEKHIDRKKDEMSARNGAIGRELFTAGSRNLRQAVEQVLGEISVEDMLELDRRMERMIRKRFRALVHICMSENNMLKHVEPAMLEVARAFIGERLPPGNVAQMFLEQYPDQHEAEEEILRWVEHAEPCNKQLISSPKKDGQRNELCVCATPPGPDGEKLADMVRSFVTAGEVQSVRQAEDVVIYREWLNLALTDLEQCSSVPRRAYQQLNSPEQFTPHSRVDVSWPRERK
jgi:hypothetical protein